jgi:hypothetical protein
MGRLLLDLIHLELVREFNELEALVEQFGFEAVRAAADEVRQCRYRAQIVGGRKLPGRRCRHKSR